MNVEVRLDHASKGGLTVPAINRFDTCRITDDTIWYIQSRKWMHNISKISSCQGLESLVTGPILVYSFSLEFSLELKFFTQCADNILSYVVITTIVNLKKFFLTS